MKIKYLTKHTTGYTFTVGFGPFLVRNWWYNPDTNNIVPPSNYIGERRYPHVIGRGTHFRRLRDIVKRMIELGIKHYDSDDMLLPDDRSHRIDVFEPKAANAYGEEELEFADDPIDN